MRATGSGITHYEYQSDGDRLLVQDGPYCRLLDRSKASYWKTRSCTASDAVQKSEISRASRKYGSLKCMRKEGMDWREVEWESGRVGGGRRERGWVGVRVGGGKE